MSKFLYALFLLPFLVPASLFAEEPTKFYLVDGQVIEKRVADLEKRVAELEKKLAPAAKSGNDTVLGWEYKKVCDEAGCRLVKVPTAPPTVTRSSSSTTYYQGPAVFTTPGGGHTHTCPRCGTTWDHSVVPGHNCPVCGTAQYRQSGGTFLTAGPIRRLLFGRR